MAAVANTSTRFAGHGRRADATMMAHRPQRQVGGFLLEALIAIAIFSFAVLGIVRLQTQSIRFTDESHYRAEAMYLASALIARMWADDRAQLFAKYDKASAGTGYTAFKKLASNLPGTDIAGNEPEVHIVDGPSTSSSVVDVRIRWQLPGEGSPHQYAATSVVGQN